MTSPNRRTTRVPIETVTTTDQLVITPGKQAIAHEITEVVFHDNGRVAVRYRQDTYGSVGSLAGPRGQLVTVARMQS